MKNKKVLSMMLAFGMVLSMTACGNTNGETNAAGTTQSKETSQSETSAGETVEVKEEPVTITVEVFDRGDMPESYGTPIDNKWVTMIKEKALEELNINIEYVPIPRAEEVTKIQALMAAGTEPDVFYTYDALKFTEWASDGALADLSEYMDTDAGKSIKEYLGEATLANGIVSGYQYSIPCPRYDCGTFSHFARKDLFDKVGVEFREINGHYGITPSELEAALVKIKEAGLCDYPYDMISGGILPGAFNTEEITEEIQVRGLEFSDGYKEAYRYANKLYNQGLINPDYPLYNSENLTEMISSGTVAFWGQNYWLGTDAADALYVAQPDAEIVAVELLHEDGTPSVFDMYAPVGAYGLVSSSCENVEAAVELLNWFATNDEVHMLLSHGIEGVNYEIKDGIVTQIDPEFNAKDRIRTTDLNLYLNNDPCTKEIEDFNRVMGNSMTKLWGEKIANTYLQAHSIAISEGKYYAAVINSVIQSSIDYAAELKENKSNLGLNSVVAPVDKFDEVFDEYYKVYMEEGAQQVADEKWAVYSANE